MKINDLYEETIINEAGLSRIKTHVENRNIGLISACRNEYDVADNNKRTQQLKKDIVASGFGFLNIIGSYIENKGTPEETKVIEKSFLVIGTKVKDQRLLNFLCQETKKFNQESFLYKEFDQNEAVFVNSSGKITGTQGIFHIGNLSDYSSQLRGKNFTFVNLATEATIFTKAGSNGNITEDLLSLQKEGTQTLVRWTVHLTK